ncbi:MAG: ParB/RepB/Spo0J family partition protein [Cytophagaceae bacterium]|nr:ParB/RepB/Spo0J family partition protein [Cytophagaceae bacterium]MBK9510026.1 ParB/RepB/Spo0J family partition protein [Cytophagaceae bacterium]MBK9933556.1 ParB/RepB/Spo0J family partition protein [Cytophagaceae bacterium]MBL0302731.1 ParB/RepB/Spo0J family partition protein [Cytophagaceae bacterium]MBL0325554.1 ParB/RepB/Spo0J family partition protein [Cytophagaceae bacterium]
MQMENKGKGLNSLLSDSDLVVSRKVAAFRGVKEIEISKLEVGVQQPRSHFDEKSLEELAESIRIHGLIQPITVREIADGKFEIISGERRFRASKLAGLTTIPTFIRDVDDNRSLQMALIENIQRENLNPIEIALSYQRMIQECDLKQDDLGKRVGKSRSSVTNYLRLLNLPSDIQSGLVLGVITMGQAKPLISIEDKNLQIDIYQRILEQGLSAREIEALAKKGNAFEAEANDLDLYREDLRIEEITLKGKTVVPFKIQVQDLNKGNISIKFSNQEQLTDIMNKLSGII